MHIQQKISDLLMSQASSLIMGHLDSSSQVPGMKCLMEMIVDTDILSTGVACQNSENWNEAVLVRSLTLSIVL